MKKRSENYKPLFFNNTKSSEKLTLVGDAKSSLQDTKNIEILNTLFPECS